MRGGEEAYRFGSTIIVLLSNETRTIQQNTCVPTRLATALPGGQVYAEVRGTDIDYREQIDSTGYYCKYSHAMSASIGTVTIKDNAQGDVSAWPYMETRP